MPSRSRTAPVRMRMRGFSIVELLITLTIAGVVLGSMMAFFVGQVKSSRLADTRIEAIQRARFASDLLRRDISLAGSGMPNAQPMVVYAGPNDFIFSSDLASSVAGDRVALYVLPGAPVSETEGADSGSVGLPNGEDYPKVWYGGGPGLTGPAETVHFAFVDVGGGTYALTRSINGLTPDTLLHDMERIGSDNFFSYEFFDDDGLKLAGSGPYWHAAPIHDSPADTGVSAQADSIKLVHARFKVKVQSRKANETVKRSFASAIALKNAGLIHNPSCGDPPDLGVTPNVTVSLAPLRVEIRWPPANDERSGEEDVFQYTIYRRKASATRPEPIATVPPDKNLASYLYMDTDVELGESYVYYLGATDCTPTQSPLAQSGTVTVS